MKILTPDQKAYELDSVPNEVEDLSFCVLDYSDSKNPDYFYVPLVFLESFQSPAAVLRLGNKIVQMPLDWSMIVCDEEFNDVEILPLTSLNDRGFDALIYNPFNDTYPKSAPVDIINVYADIKWYFPKLKPGNILVVPIEDKDKPRCAFFVKDIPKINKIDIGDLII